MWYVEAGNIWYVGNPTTHIDTNDMSLKIEKFDVWRYLKARGVQSSACVWISQFHNLIKNPFCPVENILFSQYA